MSDSVFFIPTSYTPYDPFEVLCLPKKNWKLTKHNYKNFLNKKFLQCFYGRSDATSPWEKKLEVFQF